MEHPSPMTLLSLPRPNDPETRPMPIMDPLDRSSLPSEHHSASVSSPTQHHSITPSSSMLSKSPSPNCPLLSLPSEIRLSIYEELFHVRKGRLCLGTANGSWHRIDNTKRHRPKTRVPGKCIGILATCKQIFAEARPVLCARTQLALYHYGTTQGHLETRPVDLNSIIPNTHKIYISIQFYKLQYLTSEEIWEIMAPFVEVANNASVARELSINLTTYQEVKQECFDWVMLCFGSIESNAKISMSLDMAAISKRNLNHTSFTELLKKLLRVDDTSRVWQSQLEWNQEWHAYQARRLPKINDKIVRIESEFALSCSAARVSSTRDHNHYTAHENLCMLQRDCGKLYAAKGRCEKGVQDTEEKIADLEQKLRSVASS